LGFVIHHGATTDSSTLHMQHENTTLDYSSTIPFPDLAQFFICTTPDRWHLIDVRGVSHPYHQQHPFTECTRNDLYHNFTLFLDNLVRFVKTI